jgi:hypothetical protein
MRRFYGMLCLLLLAAIASAGTADAAQHEAAIRAAAEKASSAIVDGRMEAIADSTYPGLAAVMGGRVALINSLHESSAELRKRGLSVTEMEVVSISPTVQAGRQLHSIVRMKRMMNAPNGIQVQDTFLIAVSEDAGASWSFVEGRQLSQDQLKVLFPDFNPELKFPATAKPVFIRDGE